MVRRVKPTKSNPDIRFEGFEYRRRLVDGEIEAMRREIEPSLKVMQKRAVHGENWLDAYLKRKMGRMVKESWGLRKALFAERYLASMGWAHDHGKINEKIEETMGKGAAVKFNYYSPEFFRMMFGTRDLAEAQSIVQSMLTDSSLRDDKKEKMKKRLALVAVRARVFGYED
jgi:hypothetical protein